MVIYQTAAYLFLPFRFAAPFRLAAGFFLAAGLALERAAGFPFARAAFFVGLAFFVFFAAGACLFLTAGLGFAGSVMGVLRIGAGSIFVILGAGLSDMTGAGALE